MTKTGKKNTMKPKTPIMKKKRSIIIRRNEPMKKMMEIGK